MKNNTEKVDFEYLPNFNQEEMESLLKAYEQYLKQNNLVRIPGFFMLGTIGVFRMLQDSMPRNQLITIVMVVITVLLIWLFVIGYKLIKQRRMIKNQLETIADVQNYPFKEVKKEFNTLVKSVYKGPKI
ncbi:hypothetical protein [Sphingobacterium chuzhouense]|uniref:Uncharacterized protein n=1 Tax=Sphingobacterium chuzhouense TaxID=1742264 RepID=A0ABR7XVZ2_9SPHI|nr:hypothetical protein [Sphingobacterium chuzhouense]MBD1423212.1 hypothetical protein [Sphingobacterium chuzhouense]